ncbi:MAG TPA: dihydrodipicolinate synthase family protein [Vicinamibacterales bacterium]|jgi:4-hydroxy-tetrahydrodipicolinate synthase|nr:dihydrodipicolinate synthase family protein [Vicinamibacterales bacterium]
MTGVIAAVATPVTASGALHVATFERLVDFLIESGVDGLCLGGATSEYPNTPTADRREAISAAARRVPGDRALLVAIGAPSSRQVLELGESARDAGCRAVLLPMPMFFRYEQHDLEAFAVEVSRGLATPVLLYDLPDFTNGLEPTTVITLLTEERFIVGIKDSSGVPDHLSAYADARGARDWTLLVGHDGLLLDGLRAGWNGTVSGIACFCPELPLAIYRSSTRGDVERARRLQALLDEVIVELGALPAPWGIRIALEVRGFDMGPLPLPLSVARRGQVTRYREWLPGWMNKVSAAVRG